MSWYDDEGKNHAHILTNVCCIPDSPFKLFSVNEIGTSTCTNDNEELIDGTSIQTFSRHSVFKWEDGKDIRTFVHPTNSLARLFLRAKTHFFVFN